MSENDEIVQEFLVESFENLDQLDQDLIALEKDPNDQEIINKIFRNIHTIKGTCGFLEFHNLESISHVGENLLDSLRCQKIHFNEELASTLLSLVDAIRMIMQSIEETGAEGEFDYSQLVAEMHKLNNADSSNQEEAVAETKEEVPQEAATQEAAAPETEESPETTEEPEAPQVEAQASEETETNELDQVLSDLDKDLEKHRKTEEPAPEEDSGAEDDLMAQLFDGDDSEESPTETEEKEEERDMKEDNEESKEAEKTEAESQEAAPAESSSEDSIVNEDLLAEVMGWEGDVAPEMEAKNAESAPKPEAKEEQKAEEAVKEEESAKEEAPKKEESLVNEDLLAEVMGWEGDVAPEMEAKKAESAPKPEAKEEKKAEEPAKEEPKKEAVAEESPAPAEKAASKEEVPAPEAKATEEAAPAQAAAEKPKEVKKPAPKEAPARGGGGLSIADSSLRVDVSLLDSLMNLVGELVLARNQIMQHTKIKSQGDNGFLNTCQRLNLITSELQEGVMKTRMQPIANVWNKFPRIVRDVARACGKEIKIEMEGKETDLDKTILEAIKDPLTHIVRNAADHGIEEPDDREAAGKPREGTLLLKAFHEGGHVMIEIIDDGRGLNKDKIKAKAIEKGVITPERAARMSEVELNRLIFAPGFSTAEKVTNISGRGVGMDVVRSNIEKIGGSVDIISKLGEGTTLRIKIPLTLAIVPALIVSSSEQRFAIPQVSLVELLRLESSQIYEQIEEIKGSLFYRLRGDLLPILYLSQELDLAAKAVENEESEEEGKEAATQLPSEDSAINIIVVKADDKEFGLVVDSVHDTEEIVVKPLGRQLKDINVFAGATIMGDGKAALILDVLGIGKQAQIVQDINEKADSTASEQEYEDDKESLLLVMAGGYRFAVPLAEVNRLEEFKASDIEYGGGRMVVQYRGGILPLISLPKYFGNESELGEDIHVVVYTRDGVQVGFIVEQILDIVDEKLEVREEKGKEGIVGSAIIQEKITDILDIEKILDQTQSMFYASHTDRSMTAPSEQPIGTGA